ncbi:IS3 family transposase [Aggregatibacter actinomycetemcomitans]|uniref:IS3 family transposase n=1 Tax=Aggregatibacter actinomycetemcomitans TaxID=714 RepID=UPI0021519292|nr:IS3 family transposase [Aggregatibacter actinomycetemcomitans]
MNDLLRVAKMPRSTFYYQQVKHDYREIKETILLRYKKNRKRDGYRPMTLKLRQMGFHLNHKTVLKLMNALGIHSILRKKRHGKRGKTSHIAPNVLNRDFTATALNQKWVTDVTEFRVGEEKLYFSPLMDLANREIIAYNFAKRPKFSLVKRMPEEGLGKLKPSECPIIHSDQGVLYGSAEWVKMLEGKAIQSMSRRGNCYDNAVIESFFAILKSECFYSRTYTSIAELQAEIEEYLVYYNQERIKLDLKGLSPVQYRAQYLS